MRWVAHATVVALVSACRAAAPLDHGLDFGAVRLALEQGAAELDGIEEEWRRGLAPETEEGRVWSELFGYAPPGRALSLAYLHGFLYEELGEARDAVAAAGYLARMARYRAEIPAEVASRRVEYADGLPAAPSFFHVADFAETWLRIRGSPDLDAGVRREVEDALASSAEFVFVFPEWGAHNRAMLRAVGLAYSALALPDHPRAAAWREMAEILAADSLDQWEIEDAQLYHPIWLQALMRYAHATGDEAITRSLQVRYYLRYFQELLTPLGTLPDFGDAWWRGGLPRTYTCLAWGAAALGDAELEWAARRVYAALGPTDPERPGLGRVTLFARVHRHLDPELEPREPAVRSGPVLDDLVGKKIVVRGGWGEDDLYLCLNYRDEGDWGVLHRDYLRQTLAVVEEKMHHGHSDENSIVLLMDGGSVLLHDAGYRDVAPSGPYGAYRADIFHNRLVARPGLPAPDQGVLEFLRDDGAYRPARTEKIDFVRFESATYSRTRVDAADQGWVWDRTLVIPDEPRLVVVVDSVRIETAGEYTLGPLWATQEVVDSGPGWAVCANRSIGGEELSGARQLLITFPEARDAVPPSFPLVRHRQEEHVLHQLESRWFEAGETVSFVTVLWSVEPGVGATTLAPRVWGRSDADSVALTISPTPDVPQADDALTLVLKTDLSHGVVHEDVRPRYDPEAGRLEALGVASDADLLLVRYRGDGAHWSATNMTFVEIAGREAFRARPFQVFQTTGRSDVVGRAKWRRWEGVLRRE